MQSPQQSKTIIHLGGPVWLTTAEEVSKFLLQCILQQNMNLLANQFLMPAFRAPCCLQKAYKRALQYNPSAFL